MKFLASRSNYDVVVAVNCCNGLPTNDYNLPYCCSLNMIFTTLVSFSQDKCTVCLKG